jgi:ribulose-5-phosphate 4-epimerase/fuculose-1-phosphate aldolase
MKKEIYMDEGYIKYQAKHQQVSQLKLPQDCVLLAQDLIKARDYLHSVGLIGVYPNGIGFGNCSFRTNTNGVIFEKNEFVITGSATGAVESLSMQHLCSVKKIDVEKNKVWSVGAVSASSESMTHGAVYSANNKTNCVLHIHSRKIFDFMKQDITPKGNYNFTAQNIPYGTPLMAKAVMAEVQKMDSSHGIIVMLGHDEGIISFGENISVALETLEDIRNC